MEEHHTPTVDMDSSPTQRLMSRRTRHSLPLSQDLLQPKLVDDVMFKVKYKRQKAKMYYDRKAKDLPELEIGQPVRVNQKSDPDKKWQYGTCVENLTKRSYVVDVNNERYRRNRRDLRATNETHEPLPVPECEVTFDSLPVDSPAETPPTPKVKENRVSTPPKVPTPLKPLSSDRKPVCGNQIKFRASSRVVKLPRKL